MAARPMRTPRLVVIPPSDETASWGAGVSAGEKDAGAGAIAAAVSACLSRPLLAPPRAPDGATGAGRSSTGEDLAEEVASAVLDPIAVRVPADWAPLGTDEATAAGDAEWQGAWWVVLRAEAALEPPGRPTAGDTPGGMGPAGARAPAAPSMRPPGAREAAKAEAARRHGHVLVGQIGWAGAPVDGSVTLQFRLSESWRGVGVGAEAIGRVVEWAFMARGHLSTVSRVRWQPGDGSTREGEAEEEKGAGGAGGEGSAGAGELVAEDISPAGMLRTLGFRKVDGSDAFEIDRRSFEGLA